MAGKPSKSVWRTKEYWAAGDPPLSQVRPQDLAKMFGGARAMWSSRRVVAAELNQDEKWGLDFTFSDRVAAVAEKAAKDCPPVELTIEQILTRDKALLRANAATADYRRRYEAALKTSEMEERIIARMESMVDQLTPFTPKIYPALKPGKLSKEVAVLQISDWHFGEEVSSEETGGFGNFSFEVAARRLQHLVDKVINIVFNVHGGADVKKLVIFMLGDMISGIIHEELVEAGEETVMEWLIWGAHLFAQAIRELAVHFEEIEVEAVVGNHGRLQKQYRFKKKYVGWDYLFYHFLAIELKDVTNVSWNIPRSFWLEKEIEGWNFVALHGDNVKSWAGIPWYGIQRMESKLTALLASDKRFFDYMLLGHFHNSGDLDRAKGEIFLNGSAVGGNEFSIGALWASSAPKQWLYGVHRKEGVSWRYPLNLAHGDEIENLRYFIGNPVEYPDGPAILTD